MATLYDIFYQLWASAFGTAYEAEHSDLLSLLSTVCVIAFVYGLFNLFCHVGKKVFKK